MSDNAYTRATSLYAQWQRGELMAEGLEAKARIILGWDAGTPEPLTDAEREEMRDDAYHCDPNYPPDEAPMDDDVALCLWWIRAMESYVQDLF